MRRVRVLFRHLCALAAYRPTQPAPTGPSSADVHWHVEALTLLPE